MGLVQNDALRNPKSGPILNVAGSLFDATLHHPLTLSLEPSTRPDKPNQLHFPHLGLG